MKFDLVLAVRFTAWTLMLAKALFVLNIMRTIDQNRPIRDQIPWFRDHLLIVLSGMVLMPCGWFLHQIWWWIAEKGRHGSDGGRVFNWLLAHSEWTAAFYVITFAGVILMFSGWLHVIFGYYWPFAGIAAVAVLMAIGGCWT